MPALEDRIFQLVNDERRARDSAAPPLLRDPALAAAARAKSGEMAIHKYLAHTAPDGQTSATLLMDADPRFAGLLGENIAAQPFPAEYGIQVDTYARHIVDVWIASPRHRDNLADRTYSRTGIGAAIGGNTIYVTELFANTPR